jgi:hypothetical protein
MSATERPSVFWPADSPAVIAHINLLEGIIGRLATHSASCKTWCITLVAALLSLAGATKLPAIVGIVLVPIVVFGFMDTMYLSQERAYRDLYLDVVKKVRAGSYALADAFEAKAPLRFSECLAAVRSWAVFPIYLGLIAAYIVAYCSGWLSTLARPAGG